MKAVLWIVRIIVGVLFIFSGLIKANDPLGLSYKMVEFFEVLHLSFLVPYALAFSVLMIAFEIIAGIAVLLGYAYRLFSFLLLILIIFFTFLTGFALFSGKIKECGCFGDCIKITSDQSFYKDLILLVLIVILFIYRKHIKPLFPNTLGTVLMLAGTIFSFYIQYHVLNHLPVVDCLAFKVGNNIPANMKVPEGAIPDKYETVFIYEKDGKQQEFSMTNYPWEDSTWKFVDRKDKLVQKGNAEPAIKDFSLTDASGTDLTEQILAEPGYVFLVIMKDPTKANTSNMDKLKKLYEKTVMLNIPFYMVSGGSPENNDKFKAANNLGDMPFLVMDGTVAKTAMRANPGLMLIKAGTIVGKWHNNDFPSDVAVNSDNQIQIKH